MTANSMKASELFDLTGQVALVTGASSGLGVRFRAGAGRERRQGRARRAARRPACRREVKKIEAAGGQAIAVEADVLDRAAMARAFDAAEKAFGTVTILVNNAGVAHGGRRRETCRRKWRRVLSTNLDAVFFWAQEAARRMLAAKKQGAIVNIASVLGFGVSKGAVAYATAKAGVVQLTKALALELAFKGVRVNAIAPGCVVTEINREYLTTGPGAGMAREIPVGRLGEDGDLDGALLLLASDAGRFIAGTTIVVDGGKSWRSRGRRRYSTFLQRRHADLHGAAELKHRPAELVDDLDFLARVLATGHAVADEVVLLLLMISPPFFPRARTGIARARSRPLKSRTDRSVSPAAV